jgi:hypothetical protein
LDLSFNDAKGYGGIAAVRDLSERSFESLTLSLSNNEFRDDDVRLMRPHIKKLIQNNANFQLEFIETAISRVVMK